MVSLNLDWNGRPTEDNGGRRSEGPGGASDAKLACELGCVSLFYTYSLIRMCIYVIRCGYLFFFFFFFFFF